jgi:hypothetical protein
MGSVVAYATNPFAGTALTGLEDGNCSRPTYAKNAQWKSKNIR